jgi:hypothetical protein
MPIDYEYMDNYKYVFPLLTQTAELPVYWPNMQEFFYVIFLKFAQEKPCERNWSRNRSRIKMMLLLNTDRHHTGTVYTDKTTGLNIFKNIEV